MTDNMTADDCIFCKIANGTIPARKIYEDAQIMAFHDIHPIAKVHFLVVPKRHIVSLLDTTTADAPILGELLTLAPRLAREQGLAEGFRTIVNTGKAGGQSVFHLHLHVFGGGGKAEDMIAKVLQ